MTIASRIKNHELAANIDIETVINCKRYETNGISDHAQWMQSAGMQELPGRYETNGISDYAQSMQSAGMQELPGHLSLSRFVDNVVAYVAGFVVKPFKKN